MGLFSYDFSESLEKVVNYKSNTQKTKEYETIFLGNGNKKRKGAGYMHIEETKAS
jgi:hypothetical protein